jgi:hypothetical protein
MRIMEGLSGKEVGRAGGKRSEENGKVDREGGRPVSCRCENGGWLVHAPYPKRGVAKPGGRTKIIIL